MITDSNRLSDSSKMLLHNVEEVMVINRRVENYFLIFKNYQIFDWV